MLAEILEKYYRPWIPLYDGLLCLESKANELIAVCREITPRHLGVVHLPR